MSNNTVAGEESDDRRAGEDRRRGPGRPRLTDGEDPSMLNIRLPAILHDRLLRAGTSRGGQSKLARALIEQGLDALEREAVAGNSVSE